MGSPIIESLVARPTNYKEFCQTFKAWKSHFPEQSKGQTLRDYTCFFFLSAVERFDPDCELYNRIPFDKAVEHQWLTALVIELGW